MIFVHSLPLKLLLVYYYTRVFAKIQTIFAKNPPDEKFNIKCTGGEQPPSVHLFFIHKAGENMKRVYKYLTFKDRRKISRLYLTNERVCDIAKEMDVTHPTIYRELKRGYTGRLDKNGNPEYDPDTAESVVQRNFKQKGRRTPNKALLQEEEAIMKHLIKALTSVAATVLAYKYLFPAIATETLTNLHQLGFSVSIGATGVVCKLETDGMYQIHPESKISERCTILSNYRQRIQQVFF